MVEVHPVDKAEAEALATRLGTKTPTRAMRMKSGGEEIGYVLYTVEGAVTELTALFSQDESLEELLVRAFLNDAANANATDAICANPTVFPLLERLGFHRTQNGFEIFIPEFFLRPCSGCY